MAVIGQRSIILWTATLVLLLAAANLNFLLDPPGPLQGRLAAKKRRPAVLGSSEGARSPAASQLTSPIATATASPTKAAGGSKGLRYRAVALDDRDIQQAVELKLSCLPGGRIPGKSLFAANVTQVRLSGDVCGDAGEIASTEVTNDANGFSATVFSPTPRSFTTDYIMLAHGPNHIRIVHILKSGARQYQETVIERQAEAKDEETQNE